MILLPTGVLPGVTEPSGFTVVAPAAGIFPAPPVFVGVITGEACTAEADLLDPPPPPPLDDLPNISLPSLAKATDPLCCTGISFMATPVDGVDPLPYLSPAC